MRRMVLLVMMLRRVLRGGPRGAGRRGAPRAADPFEAPRQLQHLGAERVEGGHRRGRQLALRQPELVRVQGRQFRVGGRARRVLRRAAAAPRPFVQQEPFPGASPLETCEHELKFLLLFLLVLFKYGKFRGHV